MSMEYALSSEAIFYNRNISTLKYRLKKGTWREKMPVYAVYGCLLLLRMAEYGPGEKKRICSFSVPVLSICPLLQGSSQAWWGCGHAVLVYSWWVSSKMLTESSDCCTRLRTQSSCSSGICYLQLPFLFHRYFRLWISYRKKESFSYSQFQFQGKEHQTAKVWE